MLHVGCRIDVQIMKAEKWFAGFIYKGRPRGISSREITVSSAEEGGP